MYYYIKIHLIYQLYLIQQDYAPMKQHLFLSSTLLLCLAFTIPGKALAPQTQASVIAQKEATTLILDLKFKDGQAKVLELGFAQASKYQGYIRAYGYSPMRHLWAYYAQKGWPVLLLSQKLPSDPINRESIDPSILEHYDIDEFLKYPNNQIRQINPVEEDQLLSDLQSFYDQLNKHQNGLIINTFSTISKDIQKIFPRFIFLDNHSAFTEIVDDKALSNQLFDQVGATSIRPHWKLFSQTTPVEAIVQQVHQHFGSCPEYALKPLHQARGIGVKIIAKDDLKNYLKTFVCFKNQADQSQTDAIIDSIAKYDNENNPDHYWLSSNDEVFILEEKVSSQPVTVAGNDYDGTMRVLVSLTTSLNQVEEPVFSAPVPQDILDQVARELRRDLPQLFAKALSQTSYDLIKQLILSEDPATSQHGFNMMFRYPLIDYDTKLLLIDDILKDVKYCLSNEAHQGLLLFLDWSYNYRRHRLFTCENIWNYLTQFMKPMEKEKILSSWLSAWSGIDPWQSRFFESFNTQHIRDPRTAKLYSLFEKNITNITSLKTQIRYMAWLFEHQKVNENELITYFESVFAIADYAEQKLIINLLLRTRRKAILNSETLAQTLSDPNQAIAMFWLMKALTFDDVPVWTKTLVKSTQITNQTYFKWLVEFTKLDWDVTRRMLEELRFRLYSKPDSVRDSERRNHWIYIGLTNEQSDFLKSLWKEKEVLSFNEIESKAKAALAQLNDKKSNLSEAA